MQFINGYRVVFIKLGPKHASKNQIELAIFEVLGEFLHAVRDLGLLLALLGSKPRLAVLLLDHSVGYCTHKPTPNQYKHTKFTG
jgi:hypothetical protein